MNRKVPFLIPFVFSLATSSSVFFDYNKIATYRELGMDCRVSDPEERSLIKIHQGNIEKVTMTTGCIIKSNDSRLSISCTESKTSILLSVNITGYASSDLGTWNCSDGKSCDTVTFEYFIRSPLLRTTSDVTFNCIANEDCHLSLYLEPFPDYVLRRIDGTDVLMLKFDNIQVNDAYRGRIAFTENNTYPFFNFTFLEMKLSDAGVYYLLYHRFISQAAFIIQVRAYPEQPVLSAQSLSLNTEQGLFELICSSESRTQPVFSRNPLSYSWKVNGLNPTNLHTCFTIRGPVLSLCRESCHFVVNASISVTCTVEEEGLMSKESEPLIIRLAVPVEHLVNTTPGSVSMEHKDQTGGHSTGALIGACVGCLVAGSVVSIFGTLLIIRRSGLCKKGQNGSGNSGDRNEPFYINTLVDSINRTVETDTTRQYEVLDQTGMEYPKSQYTAILSKGSGHMNEPEMYEIV